MPARHAKHGMRQEEFDVLIVGGGMVGASLACALAPLALRTAVVEAVPLEAAGQPSYDDRATALAWGSRRILETMGLWSELAAQAEPIRRIHISDRGRFGFARLDAAEEGVEALGYVLENRVLGGALATRLATEPRVTLFCPATLAEFTIGTDAVTATLRQGDETLSCRARLLVAADGARSQVRERLGIAVRVWDYGQTAIVTNVTPERPHAGVAYERFTDTGPIACLPLRGDRCTVVWTVATEEAPALAALDEPAFRARLEERFGGRLGRFLKSGARAHYPLALVRAAEQVHERVVIVGNAAHSLHPIAGQGFNLSLRDVACLAEVLAGAADPGAPATLAAYRDWRVRDQRATTLFTDGLARLFGNPLEPVALARDLGLLAFDLLPFARHVFARYAMGLGGRLPRLARGVPLTRQSGV